MSAAASVRGLAMRLTRTDACGVPITEATALSRLTSAGFVNISIDPDVFEGSDIEITAANGSLCIDDKGIDSLKGFDLTMEICTVNESILEMLTGSAILTDDITSTPTTGQVGFVLAPTSQALGLNNLMLEVWSRNANSDVCAPAPAINRPFFHWLFPLTSRWQLSDVGDYADGAQTLTLTGYAESSSAFAASRSVDEWTAADIVAINAGGPLAGREVVALPPQIAGNGYDI